MRYMVIGGITATDIDTDETERFRNACELALDRHDSKKMELWIVSIDNTRIVPRRARNLVSYSTRSREEIEGTILKLLNN
ncbi:MAG: hypothetical protein U9N81_08010 [Bacillota bacterium]|nr:hypothetical protein [Bacillota bacterium]